MSKIYILDKNSGNFLNADDAHGFTNHIGNALVIDDASDAKAMIRGLKKVMPRADFVAVAEVE
jgi:hypothetical protein